jgi:hypothetical protein
VRDVEGSGACGASVLDVDHRHPVESQYTKPRLSSNGLLIFEKSSGGISKNHQTKGTGVELGIGHCNYSRLGRQVIDIAA